MLEEHSGLNRQEAIKILSNQVKQIPNLKKETPFSSNHTKWLTNTMEIVEEVFGQSSRIYLSLAAINWTGSGATVVDVFSFEIQLDAFRKKGFLKGLEIAKGLLEAGIQQIKRKGIEKVYEGKDTPRESSVIVKVLSLIDGKLRKVIREKPTTEKQVQDALESLFIGAGLDGSYIREKESIDFSSKSYIPDFIFRKIDTVIETKLCDSTARMKEIIAEINDDIPAYKSRYGNLVFVIYDLGVIRDRDEFAGAWEANEQVIIKIVKH